MKTLFIITSIILLSFQIDRLLVNHFSDTNDSITILNNAFSGSETSPEADQSLQDNAAPAVTEVVASDGVALNEAPERAVKDAPVKFKSAGTSFAQMNSRNSLLHQTMKQSGKYLELATLQFNANDYETIETDAFNNILQLADRLIFDESLKISIAGFTDNTGDAQYNQNLSLLRARNVKQYMIDLGVNEKQIIVSANGISHPAANNGTVEGRAVNRRVEMLLMQ
jgi:outer membrane protein OmpA-like peptidoglycan-associated protein